MTKPIRIRITHIHREDGFFGWKDEFIGQTGTFESHLSRVERGYFSGKFRLDLPIRSSKTFYFYGIRYRKIQAKKKEGGE